MPDGQCERQDGGEDAVELGGDPALAELADRLRPLLDRESIERWQQQAQSLQKLGAAALMDFAQSSAECCRKFSAGPAQKLGETALYIDELAGAEAARLFLRAAGEAVTSAHGAAVFAQYLDALVLVAREVSNELPALFAIQRRLLSRLTPRRLDNWIGVGRAIATWDLVGASAYFRLESEEARHLFAQMTSDEGFDELAATLRAYVQALWRFQPLMVGVDDDGTTGTGRSSFLGPLVRVPRAYPGLHGERSRRHYLAAMAHIAAHLVHGQGRIAVGKLKPLQVALISLVEDARVENLAKVELPGLGPLWAGFHTVVPSAATTVDLLLARLARALADPAFEDANPWIDRGRRLFFSDREAWHAPGFARQLGGLLGNDLGQMRIPFNARTYRVEPSYRDDNSGLWEPSPDDDEHTVDEITVDNLADVKPPEQKPRHQDRIEVEIAPQAGDGILLGHYPEWDHQTGQHRRAWTSVRSYQPKPAPEVAALELAASAERVAGRIERLIRNARVGRPRLLKRQLQGEFLDIDACIRTTIEMRAGATPDPHVYAARETRGRELSTLVVLDISQSTRDRIGQTTRPVIAVEREAVAVLGAAMSHAGDPFAVVGFCSDTRKDVRIYEVKGFGEPFDLAAIRRLGGLRGGLSTRLGAALRHCGDRLDNQRAARRLVLVVTDGEPSDVDVGDPKYLREDARQAVLELNHKGVDVFAVALGTQGQDSLPRIFSRRGYLVIDDIEQLPLRLTQLYHRLAR
ncbi:MAG: VWA domain-containing protein [Alphaproteobacteria bacterium]|nr:VWA domain-containing protein [Alphaproteobacteria bacterium]